MGYWVRVLHALLGLGRLIWDYVLSDEKCATDVRPPLEEIRESN